MEKLWTCDSNHVTFLNGGLPSFSLYHTNPLETTHTLYLCSLHLYLLVLESYIILYYATC